MKKTYIVPSLHIHDLKTTQMVCNSPSGTAPEVTEQTTGGGPSIAESKITFWGDDDDFDNE